VKSPVFSLGLGLLLVLIPSNLVSAALPILSAEWHGRAATMGWVFTTNQLGYVFSVLLIVPLTDRVPIRRVMVVGTALTGLASVFFPVLAQGIESAALLRFLAGAGLAGVYLPGARVVAQASSPSRRGFFVALYVSAFYLGTSVSLWATGWLLGLLNWRSTSLILGLLSLAAVPLIDRQVWGYALPVAGRKRLDLDVLREGPVVRNISAYAGHSWALYIARGWLATFVTSTMLTDGGQIEAATASGSQWAAFLSAFSPVGVLLGGWLSDRMGRARAAFTIALASGGCAAIFGFLGDAPGVVLIAVGAFYSLLIAADSPIYSTAILEWVSPNRAGSAQALQAFLGFGAAVIAPVAAGLLLDNGAGWGGVFLMAGAVEVLFALPLLALAQRTA
jgi:MFS family permease